MASKTGVSVIFQNISTYSTQAKGDGGVSKKRLKDLFNDGIFMKATIARMCNLNWCFVKLGFHNIIKARPDH